MYVRIVFVLVVILSELHASMVIPSSREEVLAESDLVVVGRVEGRKSYQEDYYTVNTVDGSEHLMTKEILTDWKISVLETLKGQCDQSLMYVTWFGGTVGAKTSSLSIDFYLNKGDVALFFLTWNERNEKWIPQGGSSRVFLVEGYGGSNKLKTTKGMSVVLDSDQAYVKRTGPLLHAVTLEDFEGRKRGCVQ